MPAWLRRMPFIQGRAGRPGSYSRACSRTARKVSCRTSSAVAASGTRWRARRKRSGAVASKSAARSRGWPVDRKPSRRTSGGGAGRDPAVVMQGTLARGRGGVAAGPDLLRPVRGARGLCPPRVGGARSPWRTSPCGCSCES